MGKLCQACPTDSGQVRNCSLLAQRQACKSLAKEMIQEVFKDNSEIIFLFFMKTYVVDTVESPQCNSSKYPQNNHIFERCSDR